MRDGSSQNTLATIAVVGILALGILCLPFVGGDSLIRGVANGGRIYFGGISDQLAEAIGASPAVSDVSDDDLQAAFLAVRQRALSGEVEAAMVLFRVAEVQRSRQRD